MQHTLEGYIITNPVPQYYKGQTTDKICSLLQGFVTSEIFSLIYFSVTGEKNI